MCNQWLSPPCCYGSGPLCGHLQPASLSRHHVPKSLHPAGTGSYIMGSINASVHTGFTFSLVFCKGNTINHFFCDVPPILALSCSNIDINIMLLAVFVGFNLIFTELVIIFSYGNIITTILKMSSTTGRKKAFSTCASHLAAVTIFYGTLSYMYLQPHSNNSQENMKVASMFYGIVIPMLNPLIYSLRNKEVKEALKVIWKKILLGWTKL